MSKEDSRRRQNETIHMPSVGHTRINAHVVMLVRPDRTDVTRTFSWSRKVRLTPPLLPALRAREIRPGEVRSITSPNFFSRPGVSSTSPSVSSWSSNPFLRFEKAVGVGSSSRLRVKRAAVGGEGVTRGAEEAAVEPEAWRAFLAGVEKLEANDPSERSTNCVPFD